MQLPAQVPNNSVLLRTIREVKAHTGLKEKQMAHKVVLNPCTFADLKRQAANGVLTEEQDSYYAERVAEILYYSALEAPVGIKNKSLALRNTIASASQQLLSSFTGLVNLHDYDMY